MKKILLYTLLLISVISCQDDNVFDDVFKRGGLIEFEETPSARFNLETISANDQFSGTLINKNNNQVTYSLTLGYKDTPNNIEVTIEDFVTVNSFPSALNITLQSVLNAINNKIEDEALKLDLTNIGTSTLFDFTGKVTTADGTVYTTEAFDDFDFDTNQRTGGLTDGAAFSGLATRQALDFTITFFIPPPPKIRGTGFEEPLVGSDSDYRRAGSGNDDEGELLNNPGQPNIMYTAKGTGVDDEIGFKAEFISNGDGGFSNEEIGITRFTTDVGVFLDGVQGYRLQDVDGIMKLTFDRIPVPADITSSGVQIQFYIPNVGNNMESGDRLNVYAILEKEGGVMETMEIFNEDGEALNDLRNSWRLIDSGLLDNILAYTLIIEHNTNSEAERIYFDQMLVYKPE